MDEKSKKALIIMAVVVIIILLLYLLLTKKTPNNIPPSSSPQPPPSSSPPSPPPSSSPPPIQVTSFVISNSCSGPYCWGRVTFNSSITGTLTEVITVYSNGSIFIWRGYYQVTKGTNTIWLDEFRPCHHLSCNPPGQITALIFVINGIPYTVPVTPTIGCPLSTVPTSRPQKFIGFY